MHCDGCAKSVSDALFKLPGITKVEPNVKDQLVAIEGTAPPSAIVEAIQETGKDAILRGSGSSNGAAVSILETFHDDGTQGPSSVRVPSSILGGDAIPNRMVRGLARMVQVNDTTTLVDLTIHGIAPGLYRATIREYGDLKDGAESTGPVWSGLSTALTEETKKLVPRGNLGTVEIGPNGRGSVFLSHPFQIWEAIGHALAVSPLGQGNGGDDGLGVLKNDKDTVVGVIARSAGMWDNDKTVCSCTGKTLWEERKDETAKGML